MLEPPYEGKTPFLSGLSRKAERSDPYTYAVIDHASGKALGYMALMRMEVQHRSAEIGHVMLGPMLQRTRAATEAFGLLQKAAFEEMKVRRLEWKCNSLHSGSRRAAIRLGFTFEGVFRKHFIIKGHSRDTAWFSIVDDEWPALKTRMELWLDPSNFDEHGSQKRSLETIEKEVL